jgi:hypothetical protein
VGARARDAQGRFAQKQQAPAQAQSSVQPAQPTQAKYPDRAPQDWSPRAREAWSKLPPEVREDAWRLHIDTRRAMQQADTIRQQAEQPMRTLQHLEGLVSRYPNALRGGGGDVFRGVERLLMFGETMESPNVHPLQKARLLADMLDTFGIPEAMVGDAIDARRRGGQQPQPQNFQPQQFRDPRFDQFLGQLQQQQQRQAQEERQVATYEVGEFSQDKEFFNDVRLDMADRIEALTRAGKSYDLDSVYDWACWANPSIRQVLQQRDQASRVSQASTQRARTAAGASLRSSGVAPSSGSSDNSIRSLLEAGLNR